MSSLLYEKQIVIVDDDEIFLKLLKRILEASRFFVYPVSSTELLFEYIKNNHQIISLIIIDVFLPHDQFKKLIEVLKKDPDTKYIPIIAITGKKDGEQSKILSSGYDQEIEDFIFKPINPNEIILRCSRLIKLRDTFFSLKDKIEGSNKLINILEKKLKDITVIYNNIQLEYKKQKNSFEEKEEYFYSIAHDIKSPLNNITLGIDLYLLDAVNLNSNDHENLLEIKNTAIRISAMLQDFLSKVKDEKIGEILNFQWVHPSSILEILLREFYPEANQKELIMTLEMDENLSNVYWDQGQILRVFSNIIDNAIKFSPQNEMILIRFKQKKEHSTITIEDNGPGISEHEKEKVFDLFYQTNLNEKKSGFGIGLSFCKKMIEKHGGSIQIQNKENQKGTRVVVELPNNPSELFKV
ncbi:MAG: hypothetical protein A2Y41_01415 [Spirochaetes bacterium GWB1_36_13]|nr:MAG: hypothetical protein A2Y41_01415 [Spirochaetes bacterium GWB1_36_13]